MIRLHLGPGDLTRIRFAYSPLAEVAESLYVLHSGEIPALHHAWFDMIRKRLRRVNMEVLRAVVPAPRPHVASFLLAGASGPSTSIEAQLALVAELPVERLRADLEVVWGERLPPETDRLLNHDAGARIADALWQYWSAAVQPYWRQIRAVLDADVAYRASRLATGGITALLSDLHPELELTQHAIQVQTSGPGGARDLRGHGVVLVPCVFAWPHVMADLSTTNAPTITYGPRGIGDLWPIDDPVTSEDDPLAALLGRSRAAVLRAVLLPKSTSDLAAELDQSMGSISGHLTVLRNAGLATSWRAGRRVLYQGTPLARSVLEVTDRRRVRTAEPA